MDYLALSLLEQILPGLIPLAVAAIVKAIGNVPKVIVPLLIVPILGVAGQALSTVIDAGEVDPFLGVVFGALAILVQQVSKQVRKAVVAFKDGERISRMA